MDLQLRAAVQTGAVAVRATLVRSRVRVARCSPPKEVCVTDYETHTHTIINIITVITIITCEEEQEAANAAAHKDGRSKVAGGGQGRERKRGVLEHTQNTKMNIE